MGNNQETALDRAIRAFNLEADHTLSEHAVRAAMQAVLRAAIGQAPLVKVLCGTDGGRMAEVALLHGKKGWSVLDEQMAYLLLVEPACAGEEETHG